LLLLLQSPGSAFYYDDTREGKGAGQVATMDGEEKYVGKSGYFQNLNMI